MAGPGREPAGRRSGALYFEREPVSSNDQVDDTAGQEAVLTAVPRLCGEPLPR